MRRFIGYGLILLFSLILSSNSWGQENIYAENFDYPPGNLPSGWEVWGEQPSSWVVSNSQISGGTAPELYMNYGFQVGLSRLVSPTINLEGHSKVALSYFQYLINYGADWGETIGLDVSFDNGTTWEPLWEQALGFLNIPQDKFTYYINVPNGASTIKLGFRFEGNNLAINGWAIDGISIDTVVEKDLLVTQLMGTNTPMVGQEVMYFGEVKNGGSEAQENYTVKLMSGNQELASVNGQLVNFNEKIPVFFTWTPTNADLDLENIYAKVELVGDQNATNDSSTPFVLNVLKSGTENSSVGNGSFPLQHSIPYNFFNLYSLSQTLYLADQINVENNTLTAIQYVSHFDEDIDDVPIQIYLAETNQTELENGWLNPSNFTLVYDGLMDFKRGLNNLYIPLDTPYEYNGGNLVVYSNKSYPEMVLWSTFISTFNESPVYSRLAEGDGGSYDPMNPPTGYPVLYSPNIILFFHDGQMAVIDNNQNAGIQIYPNPAKNEVFVTAQEGEKILELQIINSVGQKLMAHKSNDSTVRMDVNKLPKGVYIVQVVTNKNVLTKKLIIQ